MYVLLRFARAFAQADQSFLFTLEYPVKYSQILLICTWLYLAFYGEHASTHACDISTEMELIFMSAQPG